MASIESVVQVVARQVRARRDGRGWSGARLAQEMTRLGVPWDRSTVAKLETGRRGAVSVPELFALAAALEVTPAALLVDLDAPEYAITPGLVVTPVDALVWLWGYGPLPGQEPTGSLLPHQSVVIVRILAADWAQLRGIERQAADTTHPSAFADFLRGQRRKLREVASAVAESGVTVPQEVTDYLAKHGDDG